MLFREEFILLVIVIEEVIEPISFLAKPPRVVPGFKNRASVKLWTCRKSRANHLRKFGDSLEIYDSDVMLERLRLFWN